MEGMDRIISFFKSNKVTITKLNHSLDSSVQQFTQFDGFIQLDEDNDDELVITLKKPSNKKEYILEADPAQADKE